LAAGEQRRDMTENSTARELISFRIGDQEYCVDIASVVEIRGWTPTTPLPQTAAYVRGVINLRGTIMPVLDLGARLGMAEAQPTSRHVIIVVDVDGRKVGLLVDSVCETLAIEPDDVQPSPDLAEGAARRAVVGFIPLPDRMITLLELDPLLPSAPSHAA
jgi:purine-binding chemotaxis protein CheW